MRKEIVELCDENNIDVLILCETKGIDLDLLVKDLKVVNKNYNISSILKKSRVFVIHKLKKNLIPKEDDQYTTTYLLKNYSKDLILIGVHLPSKLNLQDKELSMLNMRVVRKIEVAKYKYNINNIVVVGDFNMNPFEDIMVSAEGFHAIMCRETAKAGKRIVYHEDREYFYNPMWHLYGNANSQTLGTYYHNQGVITYVWHIFDQVLIKPSLIDNFDIKDLKIIHQIKTSSVSLIEDNGRPDKNKYSDHLPIKFSLKL